MDHMRSPRGTVGINQEQDQLSQYLSEVGLLCDLVSQRIDEIKQESVLFPLSGIRINLENSKKSRLTTLVFFSDNTSIAL